MIVVGILFFFFFFFDFFFLNLINTFYFSVILNFLESFLSLHN